MLNIERISFRNFKGFDFGFLDFKSINFLIGANSSGKSSTLKLLLLISQSISSSRSQLFHLKGNLVGIGDKKNLYKNQDLSKEMEFTFHYNEPLNFSPLTDSCIRAFRLPIRNDLRKLLEKSFNVHLVNNLYDLTSLGASLDQLTFCAKFLQKNSKHLNEGSDMDNSDIPLIMDYQTVLDSLLLCKTISEMRVNKISYSVRHNKEKNTPEVVRIQLHFEDQEIFNLKLGTGKNLGTQAFLSGFNDSRLKKYHREITNSLRLRSFLCTKKLSREGMPNTMSRALVENPVGALITSMLERASRPISIGLASHKIRHVSPLRAYPKRYYLVDGEGLDEQFDSESESERIIKLFQEDPTLLPTINEWLNLLGHKLEIEKIHDSIYRILESGKNTKMDLTNVGFGLSQILPVLVEPIIANTGDVVIIQQPEIHLHPKAQSIIADFFIWVTKNRGIKLFVETHSEYILRRMRRRSSEGAVEPSNESSILPSNISILSVEKQQNGCHVENIHINRNGGFDWPKDFLENELDDLIAYIDASTSLN